MASTVAPFGNATACAPARAQSTLSHAESCADNAQNQRITGCREPVAGASVLWGRYGAVLWPQRREHLGLVHLLLIAWEKQVLSARGFKRVGRHFRIRYINGMEARKKRPRGFKIVQVSPLNPVSVAPYSSPSP